MASIFAARKEKAVQSFILKLVNNNCPELRALIEGPRLECRANLVLVVLVVPIDNGEAAPGRVFAATTKEFSTSGVAVVLDEPRGIDEAALGFRWEGQMTWVRAEAKHLSPLGAGFYQLGFRMVEMLNLADHPRLRSFTF